MPSAEDAQQLLRGVFEGNFDAVKAALTAGVNVNGSPEQPLEAIAAAAFAQNARMVTFLLEQGADADEPVTKKLTLQQHRPHSDNTTRTTNPGERALHIAARFGNTEIVSLLLKRARADPNATDNRGRTPLLEISINPHDFRVDVVRLLLEAGADPALADTDGFIPLHAVAVNGDMDLVDMLYSRAPTTLHRCANNGEMPFYLACLYGHESMVSKLLSFGAMQGKGADESAKSPLMLAVSKGFEGVVRVLVNEGGVRAVGRGAGLTKALYNTVPLRQARTLKVLLTVDGEQGRSGWANITVNGRRVLHAGAGYCYPAAVSVLLEAGADEAARDSEGRLPRDVIGLDIEQNDKAKMDRGKEVAVRRMLQRGPAYRARSWAWPSDEEGDVGGSCDGGTAAAAAAAVPLFPPAVKTPSVIGVRIFRPKGLSSSKCFVRLIDRYCAKG